MRERDNGELCKPLWSYFEEVAMYEGPMRILHVCISLDPVKGGGVVERTCQMSRHLVQSGVECAILTTEQGLTENRQELLQDIEVITLSCLNKRFHIPLISYRKMKNAVKGTDIIHLSDHWTFLNVLIYSFSRFFRKPYVLCAAGSLKIYGRSKVLKKIYNAIIGKRIVRDASACIAITSDEIIQFMSYGVKADRIVIIPNGISMDSLLVKDDEAFREKFNLGTNPLVLYMGRLNAIKGPDLLIKAFRGIRDVFPQHHLVFAGPDEGLLSQLLHIAEKENMMERVHFLGYLGPKDKSRAYHAAQLLAIPSRREAMSIVVLEAGITATPVLITDQCGMNMIENAGGGRVVPATVEGLQGGLIDMLENDEDLKRMGLRLQTLVKQNFLWESVVMKYGSLYESLLKDKREALSL